MLRKCVRKEDEEEGVSRGNLEARSVCGERKKWQRECRVDQSEISSQYLCSKAVIIRKRRKEDEERFNDDDFGLMSMLFSYTFSYLCFQYH